VDRWDFAIIGAGIAGLSLAWHLNKAGKRVLILEKSAQAQGASVRNFGMVWVVGQPTPELQEIAFRSRELWEQAADECNFWIRKCGSLTLAYENAEQQVLQEFLESTGHSNDRVLLPKEAILSQFPFVRGENLKSGILSPTESAVDPREVVHAVANSLAKAGVEFRFDTTVTNIETGQLIASNGEVFHADKIIVCPGPDLYSVLPQECDQAGLIQTRLQMLRLRPVDESVKPLGIHLCAGLTLGHYANFRDCPSLQHVQDLHRTKWQRQIELGIHVLVAEHSDGTITVGDSHHYGRSLTPYRDDETDEAILEAMDEFLSRENYQVIQRWEGTYNTHPNMPYWWKSIGKSVWALNLFGTGMTLSFGLTERLAQEII
jgi:FAD dependent oxidoreductase TIGR03364